MRGVYWEKAEYGRLLYAPYHEEFLKQLKEEIPEEEHDWRGSARWISDAYIREVEKMVSQHYGV